MLIAAIIFFNHALMHIVKYRDSLLRAVWKWLNPSRCSLESWVRWV